MYRYSKSISMQKIYFQGQKIDFKSSDFKLLILYRRISVLQFWNAFFIQTAAYDRGLDNVFELSIQSSFRGKSYVLPIVAWKGWGHAKFPKFHQIWIKFVYLHKNVKTSPPERFELWLPACQVAILSIALQRH